MDQEHHFQGRWLVEHLLAGHSEQGPDLGVGGPAGGGEAGEGGGRPGEAAGEAGGDRRAGQGLGQAGGFVSVFIFVFLFQTVFDICICVYTSGHRWKSCAIKGGESRDSWTIKQQSETFPAKMLFEVIFAALTSSPLHQNI